MKKHISTKIITVILALAVMITSVLPLSAIADEISEPVNEAVVTADDLQEPEDIISEDNLY